jgi:hypothetical protein
MYFMGLSVNVRNFGGVKYHFLNIEVKSVNGWIVQEIKCIFTKKKNKNKK